FRSDDRERRRHAREKGQRAPGEASIGPREHERKHRQDARAENRQDSAEIGKQDNEHWPPFCCTSVTKAEREKRSGADGYLRPWAGDNRRSCQAIVAGGSISAILAASVETLSETASSELAMP